MPAGFPGMINRRDQATIQPEILDPTNGPTAYGVFVKMTSGKILALAGGEDHTAIVGLIARPYPVQETSTPGGALGASPAPNLALPGDIMKRGYMTILLSFGTAAKGAAVYVSVNNAGGNAVGAIGDNSDSSHCVAVDNCYFMGAADANGYVEISYNIER
jgi:hypothetical protein